IHSIKNYKGDDSKLTPVAQFFRELIPIKCIEDKVQVMKIMATFEEQVEEARVSFKALQEVCAQVTKSEKLAQILHYVLNVGNIMNAGTINRGVEAFKFESLLRLSQTKSADGKTMVLDYIVKTHIEEGQAGSLMPKFPNIQVRLRNGDLCFIVHRFAFC
ncbi:hypothetical protein ACHAXR_001087, partial [Thalassiosira sp. AJA248-18]